MVPYQCDTYVHVNITFYIRSQFKYGSFTINSFFIRVKVTTIVINYLTFGSYHYKSITILQENNQRIDTVKVHKNRTYKISPNISDTHGTGLTSKGNSMVILLHGGTSRTHKTFSCFTEITMTLLTLIIQIFHTHTQTYTGKKEKFLYLNNLVKGLKSRHINIKRGSTYLWSLHLRQVTYFYWRINCLNLQQPYLDCPLIQFGEFILKIISFLCW